MRNFNINVNYRYDIFRCIYLFVYLFFYGVLRDTQECLKRMYKRLRSSFRFRLSTLAINPGQSVTPPRTYTSACSAMNFALIQICAAECVTF